MEKNTCKFINVLISLTVLLSPAAYALQEKIDEILKESYQAVVSIVAYDSNKKEISQGKGVIISSDGLVLTNYHLICLAHSAKVHLAVGKIGKKVEWKDVFAPGYERAGTEKMKTKKPKGKWVNVEGVVGVDKNLDFVVLKIGKKGYTALQLAASDKFEIGDKAYIIVGEESIAEGIITRLKNLIGTKIIAQINIPFSPEMSGSPLFNSKGEVIGIASYITDNSKLILPASYALPLIKKEKGIPLSKAAREDYFLTSEGLYLKGIAYSIMENYTTALSFLEESLKKNPNNSFTYSEAGFLYSKINRYEKAVEAYREAVNMNPNDYKAFFGLGIAYTRLNQHQKAIAPLTQCTTINPEFPDAFYNLGLAYETLKQLEKAAEAYQQFIKINPGPAWTGLNQLGSVYVKLGQYDKAIPPFQEVIKSNPSDIKATYNLAYSYDMSGQYDLAAPLYKKLISLNPRDAKAYNSLLFRLYDKAGQYEKAIEVCQEIISQSPDNPNDHYNLGIMYFKLQGYEKALEAFNQALSLSRTFDPAYYNIGLVYFNQKKFTKAIEAFTKFSELKPDNPDAYYNIGVGYLQLKKYDDAIKPLQRVIELKPDYARAHYNLALAYYAVHDRFSANEEYKTLKTLNPDLAEKLRKIIQK